jgi:hypothetical protein
MFKRLVPALEQRRLLLDSQAIESVAKQARLTAQLEKTRADSCAVIQRLHAVLDLADQEQSGLDSLAHENSKKEILPGPATFLAPAIIFSRKILLRKPLMQSNKPSSKKNSNACAALLSHHFLRSVSKTEMSTWIE